MSCDTITPISAFQSTNLNSKIDSFHRLGERIVRSLGAPLVSVEVSQDQLYENISIACEMFSKFAGYTKEYLIFDSALYERGRGIRIDTLYTLANNLLSLQDKINHKTESVNTAAYLSKPDNVYIVSCPISKGLISTLSALSSVSPNGMFKNEILDKNTYSLLVSSLQLSAYFTYTPSTYTTLTSYHTTQNPIPNSIFSGSSTLSSKYSSGLEYNVDLLDFTDYSEISSYKNSYNLSNFFSSQLTNYNTESARVLNDIPLSIFLNNELLSSTISKKLSVNEIISNFNYNLILSGLSNVNVDDYFDTSLLSSYSISLDLSSNVWKQYPSLSGYEDALTGDSITQEGVYIVESSIGLGFPLSSFVSNPHLSANGSIYHDLSGYLTLSEIPSSIFSDNSILSGEYPNGLSANSLLSDTQYIQLTSNISKLDINKFIENRNTPSDINYLDYAIEGPSLDGTGYMRQLLNKLYDIQLNIDDIYSIIIDYPITSSLSNYSTLTGNLYYQFFTTKQLTVSGLNYNSFNYISGSSDTNNYSYKLSYETNTTIIPLVKYYNLGLSGLFTSFDIDGNGVMNPEFSNTETLTAWWMTNYDNISAQLQNEITNFENIFDDVSSKYNNFSVLYDICGNAFNTFETLSTDYGSTGLSAGTTGNSYPVSSYANIINIAGGFDTKQFLDKQMPYTETVYVTVYDVVNGISSKLLLTNSHLSAQFGLGIYRGTALTESEYNLLSSYQSNIPFSNNYELSGTITLKTCNTNILSNIWSPYQTLSSTYSSGLSVGQVIYPSEYNQIQIETGGAFNENTFFSYVSSTRYTFTNTNVLCANIFSNSMVLSSIYPNGISQNTTMLSNEYNILSSNFDSSISNFYKSTIKTTLHIDPYYTTIESIPSRIFENTALDAVYPNGIETNSVLNQSTYNILNSIIRNPLKTYFCESRISETTNSCDNQCSSDTRIYNNMFDYDIMDYRKVIAITDFEEGSSAGLNTLFTIEQTLAQQTYFSYAMGNYGFDLISWWTVKNWLETREKVLALKRSYEFDDRTQYLRLYPEPTNAVRFYGVFPAYVERPLRDLIKELWVYKYALALTKINVGMVRGKLGSTTVMGGQIFSQDLLQQGITERDALEQQLYTTSAGLGDADPVTFFIG